MATNQQVIEELTALKIVYAQECARVETLTAQVAAMYKVLVTGNGGPPLPETVRKSQEWIEDYKKALEKRGDESRSFNRSIALLVLGQVITLIVAIFV